jgi:hypothetical protein
MRNSVFLLALILVYSCNNLTKQSEQTVNQESLAFRVFLTKFKSVDLPFIYRETYSSNSIDIAHLPKLDANSSDTLFMKSEFPDETYCYGMLSDTTNFYSLIFFFPAETHYPVLATYTKTGKLIDKADLLVNGCGSDAGLMYGSSTSVIREDFTVFCADTLKYDFICDSIGEPLPNSSETQIGCRIGKVDRKGKIMIGKIRYYIQKH